MKISNPFTTEEGKILEAAGTIALCIGVVVAIVLFLI